MLTIKRENTGPEKVVISDLEVGQVFKFAEPWSEESGKQIFLVCSSPSGRCSVNLTSDEVVPWSNKGHEKNLAIVINARVEIN